MISIIHPSRGRPEKSADTFDKWMSLAGSPNYIEFILSLDEDEPTDDLIGASRYITLYNGVMRNYCPISFNNKSAVQAINRGADKATGDIFIVVSDDTAPCEYWDKKILKEVEGKTDWILKTQDGIQPWIITMPIMDRVYYNRFGYIYYPGYKHLFCDTELTCVADITGRKLTSSLLFPHNHYSIGKSVKDEISVRADATNAEGEKLFIERYKMNFDLPKGNKIEDKGMIDWLLKKNVA